MTRRLLLTIGLPASGKTTYARGLQPDVVRINRDDLRRMLHGARLYTEDAEAQVTAAQHAAVRAVLAERPDAAVIADDTNLHPAAVAEWRALAAESGADVEIIDFRDVPLHECVRRNEERPDVDRVDKSVIAQLHNLYLGVRPVTADTPRVVQPIKKPEVPRTDRENQILALHAIYREGIEELRDNLAALRWWHWRRRRNLEHHLAGYAIGLVRGDRPIVRIDTRKIEQEARP